MLLGKVGMVASLRFGVGQGLGLGLVERRRLRVGLGMRLLLDLDLLQLVVQRVVLELRGRGSVLAEAAGLSCTVDLA